MRLSIDIRQILQN